MKGFRTMLAKMLIRFGFVVKTVRQTHCNSNIVDSLWAKGLDGLDTIHTWNLKTNWSTNVCFATAPPFWERQLINLDKTCYFILWLPVTWYCSLYTQWQFWSAVTVVFERNHRIYFCTVAFLGRAGTSRQACRPTSISNTHNIPVLWLFIAAR